MVCVADTQHPVINHPVTIRVRTYRFRQDRFHFLRHDAELATMAPLIAKLRLVVEQEEADAEGMHTDADDVFLNITIGGAWIAGL